LPHKMTMKDADIQVKRGHYTIMIWTGHPPWTREPTVEIHSDRGDPSIRKVKRRIKKAKKILLPAVNMWLKSGFRESMPLEEFLTQVLDGKD
jgi:hypothetical protein